MIEVGLAALVIGGTALGVFLVVAAENRERARLWRAAARACGVGDLAHSSRLGVLRALRGRSGPLRVELRHFQRDRQERGTRITVTCGGRFHVTLRPEGIGTAIEKRLLGAREIELGDPAFDRTFFVGGTPSRVRAVLGAPARDLLLELHSAAPLQVWSYGLELQLLERSRIDLRAALECVLQRALEAARLVSEEIDVGARLADNVLQDPVADVRLESLLALVREFPEHPAARAALRGACGDASAEVRLHAGRALGEEGRETLLALAEGERVGDACAARAIAALDRHLPAERALALFERTRRARRLETARACLEVLAAARDESARALLVKVLVVENSRLAVAAARLLGAWGAAAAEAPLLSALGRDVPGLGRAAAEALGRVGSAAAVLPLKEAAQQNVRDGDFARAARQAVAQIQSRLGGAEPGQLSLASAQAGQLSLADDDAGKLSFPVGEAGQVSFPDGHAGQVSLADTARPQRAVPKRG